MMSARGRRAHDVAMRWFARIFCTHRVVIADRGGIVCAACGLRFRGAGPAGARVLLVRGRR
jgi:hypothetical protein